MKRILLSLVFAALGAAGCSAQRSTTVYEPVRFEDGTAVSGDAAAEALFAQDRFVTDTTLTEKGDTVFVVRHAGAFVRLQLDGLPAGIDQVRLVPMEGGIQDIPVTEPASGSLVLWMAKEPGSLAAAAAVGLIVWLCLPGGQSRFRHANSPEAVYEAYLEQIGELYRLLATNSDDPSVDWESVIQEMTDEVIPLYEQLPDELSDKEKTAILKDYYGGILDDAAQLQEEMKRKNNPSL